MANYYSEDVIQSVIDANDIVDLISGYLTLKRTGNSFKGKCPFHNEKTPSFSVSREKQLYHCFGCGAGGNVVTFVMEMEKLSFIDALKFLADRGNIVLPEKNEEGTADYEEKKRLYELHRQAGNYFYRNLKLNRQASGYLLKRGISPETIKKFGLGYSLEDWDHLTRFLKTKGFSQKEMIDSGLVMSSDQARTYDRFRNRIMFPIINPRGQIVGFGGRIMKSEHRAPKYLNSPETRIFSKSYELYNLNDAKKHLEDGRIYLVEGYMDVVSLYEKGIKNSVAALGTAFTTYHGKILERYVSEAVLVFDGDRAGEAATEKAMNILKKTNINVKIISLPKDEDPDSFIQKNGLQAFHDLTVNALTVTEYELKLLKKHFDLTHTDGKIGYGTAAIKVLKELSSAVEIDFYSQRIAEETGINKNVIRSEIVRARSGKEPQKNQIEPALEEADQNIAKAYRMAQELTVKYCIRKPEAARDVLLDYLTIREYRQVIEILLAEPAIDSGNLLNRFQQSARVNELVKMIMEEDEVSLTDFQDAQKIMKRFYIETQIEKITEEIQTETQNGHDERVAELMNQLIRMKKEIGRRI